MAKVVLFFPIIENKKQVKNLLPLSLFWISAPLVKAGHQVKIIDQGTDDQWQERLLEELKDPPLLFGLSVLTGKQILYGLQISKLVKEKTNSLVVWGGVHPSLLPEQTLRNEFIDLVIIGEGEETLLELVDRLDNKQSYQDVLGIAYRKKGRIQINPARKFIDLNDQPDIPYHLVDIEKYVRSKSFASGKSGRDLAMHTSRGCPHRCAFCYNKEFNKHRWRCLSAEKTVAEFKKMINEYGITAISLQDDEFFADLSRVKKICQMILAENIKLEFISSCRIDYICRMDNEFLELISKCGFRTLELGVESGSPRILKMIKKDITVEQVSEAVVKLKKVGITGKYCFMSGFPKETIDDMYQTTDLIRKIKKLNPLSRIPGWRIFTPFPGIELYQSSINEGWSPPRDLKQWAYYDFQTVKMPWVTKRMEKIIKNVVYLVKFLRLQDKPLSFIHRLLGKWVDFRWRHHLFYFVPEKIVIDLVIKLRKK